MRIIRAALSASLVAFSSAAAAQSGWNCTLRSPKGESAKSFHIQRQKNGYFGDGKVNFFLVVEDSDYSFLAARTASGIDMTSNAPLVGIHTLSIDKSTNLARLAFTYLKGYTDMDFYGLCIPDPQNR